jgi:hypothetical protein
MTASQSSVCRQLAMFRDGKKSKFGKQAETFRCFRIWRQSAKICGFMWFQYSSQKKVVSVSCCLISNYAQFQRNSSALASCWSFCHVHELYLLPTNPFCLSMGIYVFVWWRNSYQSRRRLVKYVTRWLEAHTHVTFPSTNPCCRLVLGTNRFVGCVRSTWPLLSTCCSYSIHVIIRTVTH